MQLPIPYGKHEISDEDINAVIEVLRSDYLTQGPKVGEFETAFASHVNARYAVAVVNGTTALHLACLAIDIKKGDRVLTTPMTFAATATCVLYCGGEIQFVDINNETFLLDFGKLEDTLKTKPKGYYKGVISVDYGGLSSDLEQLKEIAKEHGLWIISDSSHSPGGYFIDSHNTKQLCGNGKYSDLTTFSFHPVKHVSCGEGGIVTTNSPELYNKLKLLRTHGIVKDPELLSENHGGWYYEMKELGYNFRLTDIQAALGISQLKKASDNLNKRIKISQRYKIGGGWAFQDEGIAEMFNVEDIDVVEEARGKGLGRYLLQTILSESRKLGYKTSGLQTGRKNHLAQLLYFSIGFQAIHITYSFLKVLEADEESPIEN